MSERYDVIVAGSGAGGGVVAGEMADRGRRVLLLEAGPHKTAADYMRWEAWASHELWWPPAFAEPEGAPGPPLIMFRGRCVGGTTTINTKVALRPDAEDYAKWGVPFTEADLAPYLEQVEQRLGVRERTDWRQCVHTVVPGFQAQGAELEPVVSYTDENCMRCGSCLQGCPTNAGKSTLNTFIHPPWARGRLELRAGCEVKRVLIDSGEATGVEYADPDGSAKSLATWWSSPLAHWPHRGCCCARASPVNTWGGTWAFIRRAWSRGCSTRSRTRTWSIRSPRTA